MTSTSRRSKLSEWPALTRIVLGAVILILGASSPGWAQPPAKIYRLAILELLPREQAQSFHALFEKGLREHGYVEGKNLIIQRLFADGQADRLPALALQLTRDKPDVIFAPMTPNALAAKAASNSIPIVIALASDPVASGLAESLSKPGANVTGTSNIQTDVDPRRIQILQELLPKIRRVALIHAGDRLGQRQLAAAQYAGKSLGIDVLSVEAQVAQDYQPAFAKAKALAVEAMVVAINGQNGVNHQLILGLAAQERIPAIYGEPSHAEKGGLLSYGADAGALYYRSAAYVEKVFKGANPALLPIEQPTKFTLVLNLRTAKALGISVPQALLVRADRVIE